MKMRSGLRSAVLAASISTLLAISLAAQAAPTKGSPTCSDVDALAIVVHGHHVVRDYVVGDQTHSMSWPPAGQVKASGGAALPGGPGRGHLENGVPPGASFCTNSNSWRALP